MECLEAALWAFAASSSFREGALLAVNLGDDADTTGAVYGQLAGAFHGVDSIPAEWLDKVAMRQRIEELADGLLAGREQGLDRLAGEAPCQRVASGFDQSVNALSTTSTQSGSPPPFGGTNVNSPSAAYSPITS